MIDFTPDALRTQFESMRRRMAENPSMGLAELRQMFDELADLSSEPDGVAFTGSEGPVSGIWCTPVDAVDGDAILYLHGGGYLGNSAATHRKLAGHLAAAARRRAFVLDFPLAPEHPFPAQLDSASAAAQWLRDDQGIDPERLVLAGDSAGANLALGLSVQLSESGATAPAALVLFSPWVDLLNEGSTLRTNAEADALISKPVLEMMSSMFLGSNASPSDSRTNALYADLTGFPPMFVTTGESEALLDDARRLVERAREHGVAAELTVEAGQQHAYVMKAGRSPEADRALSSAGEFIRSLLAE